MGTRRTQGEGAIFQRKDGRWVVRVELPPGPGGKRRRAQIVRTKKADALTELRKVRSNLEKSGDLATADQTIESWVTWWLDNVKAGQVRPRTLDTYRGQAKRLNAAIGQVRLGKLTPQHIHTLHGAMGDVTTKTVREVHSMLASALDDAMKHGRVMRNVAKLVDLPQKPVPKLEALTVEEAVQVLATCVPALDADPYDPTPVMWAVALLTGLRRGELIGLEWDRVGDSLDVSWQLQAITNPDDAGAGFELRRLYGSLYLVRPKTRAGYRLIPVVEPLTSLLAAHRARAGVNPYGLVFARPDGHPWMPTDVSELWTAWRSQFTSKKVRLHDLRHTTVDLLYEAGVPEDVIIEIVGHSVIAMSRHYKARGNQRRLTDAMHALSAVLGITAAS